MCSEKVDFEGNGRPKHRRNIKPHKSEVRRISTQDKKGDAS